MSSQWQYVAGEEVHHKIYLTPENINDPYIAFIILKLRTVMPIMSFYRT